MAKRSKELKRGEGELFAELTKYLDGTISTSDKRSRAAEERDLLAKMEDVTREVLGRPKDERMSRVEIKPSLGRCLPPVNLRKSEVDNWRAKWKDKIELYKQKETRMIGS